MFFHIYRAVAREASGERCFDILNGIVRFHRLQLGPGIEEAAEYCAKVLKERGLEAEVKVYRPDDSGGRFFCERPSPNWECKEAKLWMWDEDRKEYVKLADFEESPVSVIQRSCPTPEMGMEAELVEIEDPESEESFASKDVRGKLVLLRGNMAVASYFAVKYGAIGVVTDNLNEYWPVRTRWDLPDARQYTSFPAYACEKLFGFVLTPRQGAMIRERLARGPVKLKARVRSSFSPPRVPVVTAMIPGRAREEVLLVAHICHPKPSANDNASGSAAAMEALLVLNELIKGGKLAPPRLGIRLLLVPEMGGTLAYLAAEPQKAPALAGINLDMVGENQELCGSTMKIEYPPLASRSFVGPLLKEITAYCAEDALVTGEQEGFSTLRWGAFPYSGGSDHYILSDPSIGIPTPMINQWPDRFYHTDLDTPDKVDKTMLKRAAAIAATYLYFLAAMGEKEALWVLDMALCEAQKALIECCKNLLRSKDGWSSSDAAERLRFLAGMNKTALASVARFVDTPQVREAIEDAGRALDEVCERLCGRLSKAGKVYDLEGCGDNKIKASVEEAKALVPRRLVPGTVELHQYLEDMDEETRKEYFELARLKDAKNPEYLLYYADGESTLYEISRKVYWETGEDILEYLMKYAKVLEKVGIIELLSKTQQ